MHVLLSIKPVYADRILQGTKRYEYRKALFSAPNVRRVFLYASSPVQRIVGEIEIEAVETGTPDEVWSRTGAHGGVTRELFFEYFSGREVAYALKVKSQILYETPIDPHGAFASFRAPQSFRYLSDADLPRSLADRGLTALAS